MQATLEALVQAALVDGRLSVRTLYDTLLHLETIAP